MNMDFLITTSAISIILPIVRYDWTFNMFKYINITHQILAYFSFLYLRSVMLKQNMYTLQRGLVLLGEYVRLYVYYLHQHWLHIPSSDDLSICLILGAGFWMLEWRISFYLSYYQRKIVWKYVILYIIFWTFFCEWMKESTIQ